MTRKDIVHFCKKESNSPKINESNLVVNAKIDFKRRNSIKLNQGEEFCHFNMGSTVILLFQNEKLSWLPDIKKDHLIEVGQLLANTKILV